MSVRILATVITPTHDNDGVAIDRQTVAEFLQRLADLGGGYTRSMVEGGWVHEGRLYTDRSWRYEVWLESWKQVESFLELVEWTRVAYRQIAMAISIAGIPEEVRGESGPDPGLQAPFPMEPFDAQENRRCLRTSPSITRS